MDKEGGNSRVGRHSTERRGRGADSRPSARTGGFGEEAVGKQEGACVTATLIAFDDQEWHLAEGGVAVLKAPRDTAEPTADGDPGEVVEP